jgi:histidyl-tRNA synthetase
LVLLLDAAGVVPDSIARQVDVYLVAAGDVQAEALKLGEELRTHCSTLRVQNHCGGGNLKKQMKKANESGAIVALILGENEVASGEVAIKFLREDKQQQLVSVVEVANFLNHKIFNQ